MRKLLIAVLALAFITVCALAQAAPQIAPVNGQIVSAGSSCTSLVMDSTNSSPSNCISMQLPSTAGTASIVLSGTFTATIQFEISADGGRTWISAATASSSTAGTTTFTVAGYNGVRARASSFASGPVNAQITPSSASGSGGGAGPFSLAFSTSGFVAGDAIDNTAALNSALATIFTAGGGTLICDKPGTYLFNSAQITIPNDGGTWPDNGGLVPANKPIRITGQGIGVLTNDSLSTGFTTATNGGCILDMQFNAANAKIVTLGQGQLEIDHLTFVDHNTDCATFFLTTNTSLVFHENAVLGSTASDHTIPIYSCNDAVQLGTTATTSNGTVSSIFQGYNTKIQRNFFDRVQRAVYALNWVNSITISDNVIWYNAGFATGGAIEFNCNASFNCVGNYLANNLIEAVNYQYGINLGGPTKVGSTSTTWQTILTNNACWDPAGPFQKCALISHGDQIIGGTCGAGPGCNYTQIDATQTSAPGNFFASSLESANHEAMGMSGTATADLGGFASWTGGVLRGMSGVCGSACAITALTAPSIANNSWVTVVNGNGVDVLEVPSSTGAYRVYTGGSAATNESFRVDSSGNAGTPSPFGAMAQQNKSACETTFAATTLSTGATTTNTGLNCLPANAIIDVVVYRITTTITTAANFTIGDSTTAARFCAAQSVLTAGTTGICFVQADQTGAAGPRQASATTVRVTTNVNPGAGAIRLITFYHTWTAPTS